MDIAPFKVIQGHRFWYQSKAHILTYLLSCTVSKIAIDMSIQNRYLWLPLLHLTPPTEGFLWDDLRKIFRGCQRMVKVLSDAETLPKFQPAE